MSVSPRDTDLTKDEDVNTSERGEQAEPSSDARDTGDCSRTATVGDRLQRGPDFADVAQSFRRCVIEGEWKRPDHDGDVMAVLRGLIQGTSESPGSSASADTGAVQARGQSDSLDLPVAKGAFTDASKAGGDFPSGAGIPAQSSPSARDSSSDDDASPVPVPTARRKRMARVVDSSSSSDECDCSDDGGGKDLVGARVHPAGRVSIGQSSSVGDRRSSCGSSVNGGNLADRLAAVRLSTSPAHSDDGGGGGWGGEATPSASVTLREAAPGSDSSEASIVIQKGSRLRRRVAVVDSSESEVDDQSVDGSPPTAASPAGKDPVGDEADGATDSLAERFAAIEIGEDEPKERGAAVLKKAPAPASRFLLSDSSDDDDEDLQSDAAGADATGSSGDDSWLVSDSEVQYEDGVEPDERDDAAYMPSYDSDDSDHSSDDSDYDSGKMRGGWDPALGSATTGGAATGGRAGKPPATPKSRPAAPPFTPIAVNGAQGARASAHTVLKPAQRGPMCSKFYKEFNSRVFEGSLPDDLSVTWNAKLRKTAGLTYTQRRVIDGAMEYHARIEMATKVCDTVHKLRATLLHEMCHVAAWVVHHVQKPPHGKHFRHWASRATRAYPDLKVDTCHAYSIHYKFRYRCTVCSHEFGRHSKSVDLERQRCAHCHGKIELLGAFKRDGTPVKQRKASGFSLFVKEHYASVQAAGTPHKEIMSTLARMWKERDVDNGATPQRA